MHSPGRSVGVLVIDNSHFPAPSHGLGTILYEKDAIEELWEKRPGSRWSRPDLQILTGEGDKAELSGTYAVPIAPGEKYVVGIFENGSGRLSDPHVRCTGTITAVPGAPKTTDLIPDGENGSGGTFHVHTSRQPFIRILYSLEQPWSRQVLTAGSQSSETRSVG